MRQDEVVALAGKGRPPYPAAKRAGECPKSLSICRPEALPEPAASDNLIEI
jgi:hypothetical protein